jgi:hypothetical protein
LIVRFAIHRFSASAHLTPVDSTISLMRVGGGQVELGTNFVVAESSDVFTVDRKESPPMRTNDTFDKLLEGLSQNQLVVLGVGGQRILGAIDFMAADYLTVSVDKTVVNGSGAASLTGLPERQRTTRIQIPLSAISWFTRVERE